MEVLIAEKIPNGKGFNQFVMEMMKAVGEEQVTEHDGHVFSQSRTLQLFDLPNQLSVTASWRDMAPGADYNLIYTQLSFAHTDEPIEEVIGTTNTQLPIVDIRGINLTPENVEEKTLFFEGMTFHKSRHSSHDVHSPYNNKIGFSPQIAGACRYAWNLVQSGLYV